MGPVIEHVVLNFGLTETIGVPLARADVRHWFSIGNGKFENGKKISGSTVRVPGQLLAATESRNDLQ